MAETTKITWTGATFNPWIGCAKVSAGCKNCYAEVSTPARVSRNSGLELWGVNGARKTTSPSNWKEPLKWDRAAAEAGVRRRVFCASLADVFEDREDLDDVRVALFDLIRRTPNLDWQLLTKRPETVMAVLKRCITVASNHKSDGEHLSPGPGVNGLITTFDLVNRWFHGMPPTNVWLGTSVEDQAAANTRIPALLSTPAAVRLLSMEPLLGPVDLCAFKAPAGNKVAIDWVIVGGESGASARMCDIDWVTRIVHDCDRAGVAVFVKQLGAKPVRPGSEPMVADPIHLVDKKGGDMEEWPAHLRRRDFPKGGAL